MRGREGHAIACPYGAGEVQSVAGWKGVLRAEEPKLEASATLGGAWRFWLDGWGKGVLDYRHSIPDTALHPFDGTSSYSSRVKRPAAYMVVLFEKMARIFALHTTEHAG